MDPSNNESQSIPPALRKWYESLSDTGKESYQHELLRQRKLLNSQTAHQIRTGPTSVNPSAPPAVPKPRHDLQAQQPGRTDLALAAHAGTPASPSSSESEPLFVQPSPVLREGQGTSVAAPKFKQASGIVANKQQVVVESGSGSTLQIREQAPRPLPTPNVFDFPVKASTTPESSFSGRHLNAGVGMRIPHSLKRKITTEEVKQEDRQPRSLFESGSRPLNTPAGSATTSSHTASLLERFPLPDWYTGVDVGPRARADRSIITQLNRIREMIRKSSSPDAGTAMESFFNDIRNELHKVEHVEVNEVEVKKSKLLEPSVGLPRLFASGAAIVAEGSFCPYDVVADANALYNKWRRHDFNPDILRGLKYVKKVGKKRSPTLDRDYPNRISANVFGENDLVNGQWWPLQLAALRDGAHGAAQAGIHGRDGQGAFSVLVSNAAEYAEDKDYGDVLLYCGTKGEGGKKTEHTARLFENVGNKQPVRVLRTANLPEDNAYKPKLGLRYDGLYNVVSYELLDEQTAHYLFRMERCEGQDPIRYAGLHARPSDQDMEAYNNHKEKMK